MAEVRERNGGIQRRAPGRSDAFSDAVGAVDRSRGEHGDPQSAVGAESLLRREVVGVGLADIHLQRAGAAGGVDQRQRTLLLGTFDALDRCDTPVDVSLCAQQ